MAFSNFVLTMGEFNFFFFLSLFSANWTKCHQSGYMPPCLMDARLTLIRRAAFRALFFIPCLDSQLRCEKRVCPYEEGFWGQKKKRKKNNKVHRQKKTSRAPQDVSPSPSNPPKFQARLLPSTLGFNVNQGRPLGRSFWTIPWLVLGDSFLGIWSLRKYPVTARALAR